MDKLNFLMINSKIIGKKLNDLRVEELENIILENELVFNKHIDGVVILLKDLASDFYIGVDEQKGLVRVKAKKKTLIKDVTSIKTNIKGIDSKIKESISKTYALFIDDPEIPTTVNDYKEYFEVLKDNIDNNSGQLINISKLKENSRVSASISIKESGEEYGLGKFSSISFSSSISMNIDIEEIKNFQNFVFIYNNRAINFMKSKTKNNYKKKLRENNQRKEEEIVIDTTKEITVEELTTEEIPKKEERKGIEELTSPQASVY